MSMRWQMKEQLFQRTIAELTAKNEEVSLAFDKLQIAFADQGDKLRSTKEQADYSHAALLELRKELVRLSNQNGELAHDASTLRNQNLQLKECLVKALESALTVTKL